jgi:Protein of unknown function (DUF642)/PEP-CTERM motif
MIKLSFLAVVACAAAFATTFQNGGFENPVLQTSPDFSTLPTGWSKVDPTGAGLFLELYTTFALPTLNGEGVQAYGFGGNGANSGSLSQTFDTIPGASYTVSYQYVIQQGLEEQGLEVDLLDGVNTLATDSFTFDNTDWLTASLDFTAASSSTTLRFSDTAPNAGFSTNWALDAVSVTQTNGGIATPEPSSFALLLLGGLTGLGVRRMKGSGRRRGGRAVALQPAIEPGARISPETGH